LNVLGSIKRGKGGKIEQTGVEDLEVEHGCGKPVNNKTNDELFLLMGQNVWQLLK